LLVTTLFMCNISSYANNASSPVIQTQSKLKQLNEQISTLQHKLSSANDKRGVLNSELANTEKQIGSGVSKLRTIQNTITTKERKIAALQIKTTALSKELVTQQALLASHVRARYQMGEYQPLKWILNQETPDKISRILTYYQYMVKSREQLISTIDETQKKINENKVILNDELTKNQILKNQLTKNQQLLSAHKNYHTQLISHLSNEIQTNEQTLKDAQKNKENLSLLLKSLFQQSVVQTSKPFLKMRNKLPLPVQTAHRSLRQMNQGVTFFADEGTAVTAVYPGKVVFSDWLKGYGLLLIIDHGQGFMTLYAHNQSLFKRKGESVNQNEQVASVGHSGGIKQNGLYFEIRQRGKAVPPLAWLS